MIWKKLGVWRSTPVAVKQISFNIEEKDIRNFVAEISLMKKIRPHGKN